MKILFLTVRIPYPPDSGGSIRTWNLFSFACGCHAVTLLTFLHSKHELELLPVMQSLVSVAHIETVVHPFVQSPTARWGSLPAGLISQLPYPVVKYRSKAMQARFSELIDRTHFDLIHCETVHMMQYVKRPSPIPVVLDQQNIQSALLDRVAQSQTSPLLRYVYGVQQRRMAAFERAACARCDHVVTVSQADRERLSRLVPQAPASVVINGVDTNYFTPAAPSWASPTLVFTGAMDWLPNVEGIIFFMKEILPLIRKEVPKTTLCIVGRKPVARLLKIAARERGVVVTGTVPDVRPWLAKASVVVVPLWIGGGTRLKILEAMAMGRAVVSTTIGAEGLDLEPERDIFIANEPTTFARRVVDLLKHPELAARMGRLASARVTETYGWRVAANQLLGVYDRVSTV
jgi:polysaccharide biosynthesis protein PslH